jgi:hypothetical protein
MHRSPDGLHEQFNRPGVLRFSRRSQFNPHDGKAGPTRYHRRRLALPPNGHLFTAAQQTVRKILCHCLIDSKSLTRVLWLGRQFNDSRSLSCPFACDRKHPFPTGLARLFDRPFVAAPFACTALPPLLASSCCRSLDIEAKPRSRIDMGHLPRIAFNPADHDENAR